MVYYYEGKADLVICDPVYGDPDLSYVGAAAQCLRPGGSLYVFSDSSGVAQVKLECDEHLTFQNWLIWGPNDWGGRSKRRWGQKHDDILFYTKGKDWTFNPEAVAVPKKMTQAVFNPSGRDWKIPHSVWNDFGPFSTLSKERIRVNGVAIRWQKPEALIERIVLASSNPGDLVLDFFSGVATVPIVCERLQRTYVATEIDPQVWAAGHERLQASSS